MAIELENAGLGFCIAVGLGYHGLRKKSLSKSGAVAAFLVGQSLFTLNPAFGFLLIIFYLLGSRVSKYKEAVKKKQEDVVKSARDYLQVIAASLPIITSALVFVLCNHDLKWRHFASTMALSSMGCNLGDTFGSEIGSVSQSTSPILITTLRRVPPGTNGAISLVGTFSSYVGGCIIGFAYYIIAQVYPAHLETLGSPMATIFVFGGLSGLLGSLLDSILGATVQITYYNEITKKISTKPTAGSTKRIGGMPLLSNEGVNLLSSLTTGILFAYLVTSKSDST